MKSTSTILPRLQHWLQEYLPNGEGKKENTIQSYKDSWRLVIKFFYEKKGINAEDITYNMLTYSQLMEFLSWLEKDRGCKVSSRNNRLAAISKFADYSMKQDFEASMILYKAVAKIPTKNKTSDATERAYFHKEELRIFLDAPTPKSNMGIRDHVLLVFMYATGMRADEVCISKVKDVSFLPDGKASIAIHGKGGKTRRIKIFEEPATTLKKYLHYRKIENQPDAFIFPSQRNERMSVKCLEEIYAKYLGIVRKEHPDMFLAPSYPPHSMRHTTAMHMLDAGVPLIVIKQFLGHANLATTEIYAKLSSESLSQKLEKWSQEYWNQYMDEPYNPEDAYGCSDGIPSFLK